MKRVLVTGAAGLLGSNLVHVLKQDRTVCGTLHLAEYRPAGCRMVRADLADARQVDAAFRETRPDVVVHCAAETRVDWCEDHPAEAERANVTATRQVADAAQRSGARLVHISTDSMFDGREGPYDEDAEPRPLNVYSKTKLSADRIARAVRGSLVLRCTVYGWNAQAKNSLAEWALEHLDRGEPIPGFVDVSFSPLPAHDLAAVIRDCVDEGLQGLYHLGSRDRISKFAFLQLVAQAFGHDSGRVEAMTLSRVPLRAPRPLDTSLRVGRLEKALHCTLPTAAEGVEHFRAAYGAGLRTQLRDGIKMEEAKP